MAIAFVDFGTDSGTAQTTYTAGLRTTGGSDYAVTGVVHKWTSATPDSDALTHNGDAMTEVQAATDAGAQHGYLSHRLNADADAGSDLNVVGNLSFDSADVVLGAMSFSGVDTTAIRTSGKLDPSTPAGSEDDVTLTVVSGDMGVDGASLDGDTLTAGAGQTERYDLYGSVSNDTRGAGSHEAATGTSVVLSWTPDGGVKDFTVVALAFIPAAGGGGTLPHNPLGHVLKGPFGGPIG
jgi:hypothetical protein